MKKLIFILILILLSISLCSCSTNEANLTDTVSKSYGKISYLVPKDWTEQDNGNDYKYYYASSSDFLMVAKQKSNNKLDDVAFKTMCNASAETLEDGKIKKIYKEKFNDIEFYCAEISAKLDEKNIVYTMYTMWNSSQLYTFSFVNQTGENYNKALESIISSTKIIEEQPLLKMSAYSFINEYSSYTNTAMTPAQRVDLDDTVYYSFINDTFSIRIFENNETNYITSISVNTNDENKDLIFSSIIEVIDKTLINNEIQDILNTIYTSELHATDKNKIFYSYFELKDSFELLIQKMK